MYEKVLSEKKSMSQAITAQALKGVCGGLYTVMLILRIIPICNFQENTLLTVTPRTFIQTFHEERHFHSY